MLLRLAIALTVAVVATSSTVVADDSSANLFVWRRLPDLPDPHGVAGPFSGEHNGALIVAGGANFPDGVPWRPTELDLDSLKHYYADVRVLIPGGKSSGPNKNKSKFVWITPPVKLPDVVAYGASVSTKQGIVCIGGDWQKHEPTADGSLESTQGKSADVFVLRWSPKTRTVVVSETLPLDGNADDNVLPLPDLPVPTSDMAAAIIGDVIYVAGGNTESGATKNFWRLDLAKHSFPSDADRAKAAMSFQWEKLPTWPGPPRSHAIGAAQHDGRADCFYLFSGRSKQPETPHEILIDAYRFDPVEYRWQARNRAAAVDSAGWLRLGDVRPPKEPARCVMAGTAVSIGAHHIAVFGGAAGDVFAKLENDIAARIAEAELEIDAEKVEQLTKLRNEILDNHQGFSRDILMYHTVTDTWIKRGDLPRSSQVTTTAVKFAGGIAIPTGEIRPGVRTQEVWFAEPASESQEFGTTNWVVLVVYLAALVSLGAWFSRREKSTADFFLARGRVPWWAAGISIFATMLSAITYLAIPATAFTQDWRLFIYNMGIPLVAPLVIIFYLPFFRRLNVTSAYEYLEARFDVGIRLFGSFSFVLFQIGRMGVTVLLPAMALSTVTGLTVAQCIVIMGILSTIYTALGGIEAVIWTDVLQTVLLIAGALAAVWIIADGVDDGLPGIVATGIGSGKMSLGELRWDWTSKVLAVVLLGSIFNNLLPYTSDQSVIQRYMTAADERQAKRAIWLNGLMAIPASLIFFGLGTALFVFYTSHPDKLHPIENANQIFAWFIVKEMPAGAAGLVIAGVFAAAMSSLDSSMHSIATALTTDVVRRFQVDRSEAYYFAWARCLTVAVGLGGMLSALWVAQLDIQALFEYYVNIIGLLLGILGGLFALGIFTRRTSSVHAWIGAMAAVGALYGSLYILHLDGFLNGAVAITACVGTGAFSAIIIRKPPRNIDGLTYFGRAAQSESSQRTGTTKESTGGIDDGTP